MYRLRQYAVIFFVTLSFFVLFLRLFSLQIMNYDKFSAMASAQHIGMYKIKPWRGMIYDRYGEVLAMNINKPSVFADPRFVTDKEGTAGALASLLQLDREELFSRLNKEKAFVWIKRRVDAETASKVKALGIKGIYFESESERSYPNDALASHVIGFAGTDNLGLEGLELLFDDELKGKPGYRRFIKDARLIPVLADERDSLPPQNGHNIVLTIDNVIQYIVEEEIKRIREKYDALSVTAIVMEPFSGKIYAMANCPDYDLNGFKDAPADARSNSAVCSVFEPGSVFKIVAASAALNEGSSTPNDVFDCENGLFSIGGRILHDYHPYGRLRFNDVISKSSNIGTAKIAQKLGKEKLFKYIKKFGFGEKTGIDLPGEVAGISRAPSLWALSDMTTIPIGQGIAVTPVQLASAISVIANGGYLMRPYVVEKITTFEGDVLAEYAPAVRGKVLEPETCDMMKRVLNDVVTKGTGRTANSRTYSFCGKTGTAQMVNSAGGYYPNRYYASFIGFAPMEDPLISVVISVKDPHSAHFGGAVAGPAFKNISEKVLQYLISNKAHK